MRRFYTSIGLFLDFPCGNKNNEQKINAYTLQNPRMKLFTFLCFLIVLTIACSSGCTRPVSPPSSKNMTMPAQTTAPPVSTSSLGIPPSSTTVFPQEVLVTLGPLKTIKDSELWFTMQVPEFWEVTTERMSIPEGYEGLAYNTHLYNNDVFSIITYAITRGQDQDLRNYYRATWTPLPNESTVTINGILFDRFESKSNDHVKVAYVVRKGSANERGFASVIEYSLNSSSQYQQKDFESFISTFQYKGAKEIKSAAGEEIKR
jgi:hypothetical protein